jgi:hypothetical protein
MPWSLFKAVKRNNPAKLNEDTENCKEICEHESKMKTYKRDTGIKIRTAD